MVMAMGVVRQAKHVKSELLKWFFRDYLFKIDHCREDNTLLEEGLNDLVGKTTIVCIDAFRPGSEASSQTPNSGVTGPMTRLYPQSREEGHPRLRARVGLSTCWVGEERRLR
jgi:hypothetical protein